VIAVLRPGLLSTVQDAGRPGHRAFGMPVAGAMDRCALAVANLLAGNEPGAAAVELTLVGGQFAFERAALAAIAGADMRAALDGAPVAPWSSFRARAGSVLALGQAATGVRCYLAVRGGIDVPPVLGSRSTYARARVGGLGGRPLAAGDRLPVGKGRGRAPAPRALAAREIPPCGGGARLRVLPGPQDDRFPPEAVEAFLSAAWKVTPQNDRMGYRLEGPRLAHLGGADILTDPLIPGAVQVPGSGQPIVLAVDCQTAGGYAKIATVIGPDLRLLAQARAGDEIRFACCTQAAAVRALREERATLSALARRIARGARGGRPWSST
jgi:biotin-dependent carboxylase-like uncharacterized protein